MQVKSTLDFTAIEPTKQALKRFVTMLRQVYQNLTLAINGSLGFGDGTKPDNISGTWINVVAPGTPDTNFTITHGLNRFPVGYWVMQKDRACDIYTGSVASTKTQLTLRASVASAVLRLFVVALLLSFLGVGLQAQTTNLTIQVTDAGGQSWNVGSWQATLVTPPGVSPFGPPFFLIGTTTPVPNQNQSGLLSGTGSATMTLTQNIGILPALSQWRFQVCGATTAVNNCFVQFATITATTTLNITPPALIVNATAITLAYADSEVSAGRGAIYFNLITGLTRQCSTATGTVCTLWQSFGGGGGGATLQTNGVTNATQSVLNLINGTNISITADAFGGVTFANIAPLQATCPPSGGQGTLQAANGTGGCQAASVVESNGALNINETTHPFGPDPWVDPANPSFNVRASQRQFIPNIPGVTVTISGGSLNVGTVSTNTCPLQANATCFQKGDTVTTLGGGGANGLTTPAAPTVTPANAVGETNTGLFVASPLGSSTYQFCLSALGVASQTPCGPFTIITNGQATLGPITASVTSSSLLNNTMTVVTSSSLTISPGATCQLYNLSGFYNYEGPVVTVSGTTLTFTIASADSRNGAFINGGTGTITCWNQIHVKAAGLPAGATTSTVLAVYGGAGTATNLLGFIKPAGNLASSDSTYLVFDWYGATFSPVGAQPNFVASTAPVSATNEAFSTTILSVVGTTLNFATSATTAVTGATIFLDQAPVINSCLSFSIANGNSTCRLPASTLGYFVLNSRLVIPNNAVLEVAGSNGSGGIWANDTIFFSGFSGDILGRPASNQQNTSQFGITHYPTIDCGNAWPCIISLGKGLLNDVQVNIPDGGLGYFQGQTSGLIPGYDMSSVYWGLGGQGYSSIAFYCSGFHAGGGGVNVNTFKGMNFQASQLGFGSMQTPAFISNGCGNWAFPETFMNGKGRFWRPPTSGLNLEVNSMAYSQANYMPFDTFYNVDGGVAGVNLMQHGPVIFDTTFSPLTSSNIGIRLNIFSDGVIAAPGQVLMTGNGNVYLFNGPGGFSGQTNNQWQGPSEVTEADPVQNGYVPKAAVRADADIGVTPMYSFHTVEPPPSAPTCPVSAGGSVPTGTVIYEYAYVYPDGGQGSLSNGCVATTTGGNQTVTVTIPLQSGVLGYAFYRSVNGSGFALANAGSCNVFQSFSNILVDTFSFTCGIGAPNFPSSGQVGTRVGQLWSRQNLVQAVQDMAEIATPGPSFNFATVTYDRIYASNSSHGLKCLTPTGANCLGLKTFNSYSTNHTANTNEDAMVGTAPMTFTLPHAVNNWSWDIVSISTGVILATDSGNLYVSGAIGSVTIPTSQGVHAWCDGVSCYAYGLGGGGGGGSPGGTIGAMQSNNGSGGFQGDNPPVTPGVFFEVYNTPTTSPVSPSHQLAGVQYNPQTGTTYALGSSDFRCDRGALIRASNASAMTYTALNPSTACASFNTFYNIWNAGAGTLTENSSGFNLFSGACTTAPCTALTVPPNWVSLHFSNGVDYFVYRVPEFSALPSNCTTAVTVVAGVFGCGSAGAVSGVTGDAGLFCNVSSVGAVTLTPCATTLAHKFWMNNTGATGTASFQSAGEADLPATTVFTDKANTYGAFLQDFSAGTIKIPISSGCIASASNTDCYDNSASKNRHIYANNADSIAAAFASAPTNNRLPKSLVVSGNVLLGDSLLSDDGTTSTYTGTGGEKAPVFTSTGTTAGFVDYPQGSTSAAVVPCNTANSICEQSPTAVTSYLVVKPGAAATGVMTNNVASAVDTQGFSGDSNHSAVVTIGSGTSIGSTSLCSTGNCPVGTYRVNVYLDITTACTTTGTYIVNLIYTDDQGSKTVVTNIAGTGATPATGVLTLASTSNFGQESQIIRSTGAASINYSTTATACGSGGPMVGKLYLSVEPLQ